MNARQKSLIIGAVVGATLGALGGYLFSRGVEATREEGAGSLSLRSVPAGEVVVAALKGVPPLLCMPVFM